MKYFSLLVATIAAVYSLYKGFLIDEDILKKGEYINEEYGKVEGDQPSLRCMYLSFFGTRQTVYWYASNDIMGKSRCPIYRD